MPYNPLTDEKNLVEIVSVQSFLGIFNRVYTVEDGFTLEIFRGRTYLGSIGSREIASNGKTRFQRTLRNNDTILRVNLGYRTLDINCQLPMRDGWVRPYEGIVKIIVNNSYFFALQYQQESDPVGLAKLAIEDAIKRYAQRTHYDGINDNTLRYEARLALSQGVHRNYGLEVVEVLSSNIFMDPKKAEMLSIRHQGMVDEVRIRVDADNAFTTEERDSQLQSFKNESGRAEDKVQKQHDREQAFLDAANEGLKRQLLRDIADGETPEKLVRRYPQFASVLGYPVTGKALPERETPLLDKIPNDMSAQQDGAITGNVTIVPQPYPILPVKTPFPSTSQPFYNANLGVWLVLTSLSDKQRRTWGVEYQTAFIASSLDTDGVAETGGMMPGDMIVEFNDQPIASAEALLNGLDTSQAGVPLSISVLRGGQPLDLELERDIL